MANNQTGGAADGEIHSPNPAAVVQEIGQVLRNFLAEVGGLFWFIVDTCSETLDNIRQGRAPFRATSFFQHAGRSGDEDVRGHLVVTSITTDRFLAVSRRAWRRPRSPR